MEEKMVQKMLGKLNTQDYSYLFQKAFLQPIEICLKTWETENDPSQIGKLPYGLKQIIKKDVSENKFISTDFDSLQDFNGSMKEEEISKNNYDNFLSFLKPKKDDSFQILICVSMYSQTQNELRKTMNAIEENVIQLVKKGYLAEKIAVVVMLDGIQVSHPSVEDYFEELEVQNFIFSSQPYFPMSQDNPFEEFDGEDQQEIQNLNTFIYTQDEFQNTKKRRFANRKAEYKGIKNTIKEMESLEKNPSISFQALNECCKDYFYEEARKFHASLYAQDRKESLKHSKEFLEREYSEHPKGKQLVNQAIAEAKKGCDEYLKSRKSLGMMYAYRRKLITQVKGRNNQQKYLENSFVNLLSQQERAEGVDYKYMNMFFVVKYQNQGKLSSHNWFFNGFCKELNPKYSILIDVGLCPCKGSLPRMIEQMENNEKLGGLCGYMNIKLQQVEKSDQAFEENVDFFSKFLLNIFDIQRAQQIEYHYGHLIDKPFESCFKFVHVLPGAFSAYRMEALYPQNGGDSPLLNDYFKSIMEVIQNYNVVKVNISPCQLPQRILFPEFIFQALCQKKVENAKTEQDLLRDANVNLAEDRTLCMGILKNGYQLQYLPDAYAWVDPIKTVHQMFGQRKRWMNGSLFAFDKVKESHMQQKCSCYSFFLSIQMLLIWFNNILAWFSPAIFFLTVHLATQYIHIKTIGGDKNLLTPITGFCCLVSLILFMLLSIYLNNKHKFMIFAIYLFSSIIGLLSLTAFVILIIEIVEKINDPICSAQAQKRCQDSKNQWWCLCQLIALLPYFAISMICLFVLPMMLHAILFNRISIVFEIIRSVLSFMFYSPTYLILMNIYALCRIDDISWGTKGLDDQVVSKHEMSKRNFWKTIKIILLGKFVFWNTTLGFILVTISNFQPKNSQIQNQIQTQTQTQNQTLNKERFYIITATMLILLASLFIRAFLGVIYLIIYKLKQKCVDKKQLTLEEKGENKWKKIIPNIKQKIIDRIKYYQNLGQKNKLPLLVIIPKTQGSQQEQKKVKKYKKQKFQSKLDSVFQKNKKNANRQYVSKKYQRQNLLQRKEQKKKQ